MTSPVVVLIGPPGSGKTTVGRKLATRLGVAFRDTDADIADRAGRPIADIFVSDGEPEFRRMERAAVAVALAEHEGVLALGGGAVLDPDSRALLVGAPVVYLAVGLASAAPRVGMDGSRPLLLGNPRRQWVELMEARRPVYESVATWRVNTDGVTAGAVARQIEALLTAEPREGAREGERSGT